MNISHHDCQRLAIAMLSLPEPGYSCLAARIDAEVKSANAFDGHYLTCQQSFNAGGYRIDAGNLRSIGLLQPYLRPTHPTGVRLSVKAPVGGIVIFALALRTHWETGHRGLRTIVRNASRDGEPRTAVGAVDEGIAKTAIGRIEKLSQAIWAGSRIGRDPRTDPAQHVARDDSKARFARWHKRLNIQSVNASQQRGLSAQTAKK